MIKEIKHERQQKHITLPILCIAFLSIFFIIILSSQAIGATCGNGLTFRDVWCERSDGITVSDSLCTGGSKPASAQACYVSCGCLNPLYANGCGNEYIDEGNSIQCNQRSGTLSCGESCGTVTLSCINGQIQADGDYSQASSSCTELPQGSWQTGAWGSCSATACGTTGTQTRSVTCSTSCCVGSPPASSQPCSAAACPESLCWSQVEGGSYCVKYGSCTTNGQFDSGTKCAYTQGGNLNAGSAILCQPSSYGECVQSYAATSSCEWQPGFAGQSGCSTYEEGPSGACYNEGEYVTVCQVGVEQDFICSCPSCKNVYPGQCQSFNNMNQCQAFSGCAWTAGSGDIGNYCVESVSCESIQSEGTCNPYALCEWV